MSIDYSKILTKKYPNEEWILDGDDYSGLTWISHTQKPTKETLDDLWEAVKSEIAAETQMQIATRESAIEKLAALGLTENELKAITG
jgi:hypothetical protein